MSSISSLLRQATKAAAYETFEELFTSPDGFGIKTASPLQLAICRVIDGQPLGDVWDDPDVREAMADALPTQSPEEILIISGIRSGKSLIAAALGVHMTQTCVLEGYEGIALGPGETPRVSIQSVRTKSAQAIYEHITGNVQKSTFLKSLLVKPPSSDSITLRHPSGRPVEINIIAGARAGANLLSFWFAGALFDECARMLGEDEGVINLEDSRAAVRFRLLKGARCVYITSPYEPRGMIYDWKGRYWGKPGSIFVVVAPSNVMCPALWPAERMKAAFEADPDLAAVDLGAAFRNPEVNLFPKQLCERYVRTSPISLPHKPGLEYTAAMDPATRGNAWTLVVVTKEQNKVKVALAKQWRGSREMPLDPHHVLKEIKAAVADYGLSTVITDQWGQDFVRRLANDMGLGILQEDFRGLERTDIYLSFARRLEAGLVEFAPVPDLLDDLAAVKRRPMPDGGVKIVLPKSRDGGRHYDYAPALIVAAQRYLNDPIPQKPADDVPPMTEEEEHEAFEPWRLQDPDAFEEEHELDYADFDY